MWTELDCCRRGSCSSVAELVLILVMVSMQVNLKEQGQLIRQDEFTVWSGRRKCQRHIFLFEDLVLFSKPKKMEGGLDVFIYKHSFKVSAAARFCRTLSELWF